MTDRTNHRAEAELMLTEAHAWAKVAGEPTPESNELAYLGYAQVHALLAIHDTLTAADRYAANEAKQREAGDAAGAPSVTAPAADDPADDAVDGQEVERRYLNAQDVELSRLLAVSTDPTAALRRAATMEAVGVTDDQAKLFAQILAKGRLLPDDLQRLKAAVEEDDQ